MLLSNRILDNPTQKRFFSKSELRELFELDGGEGGMLRRNNRSIADQSVSSSDLPEGAEVDLEEEEDRGRSGSRSKVRAANSSSRTYDTETGEEEASSSTGKRDKRLLKALFNGEALSAVYDHEYFEGGGEGQERRGGSMKRGRGERSDSDKRLSEMAKKAVDDAVRQLALSTASTLGSGSSTAVGKRTGQGLGLGLGLSASSSSVAPWSLVNQKSQVPRNSSEGIFSSISGIGSGSGSSSNSTLSSSSLLSNLRSLQGRPSSKQQDSNDSGQHSSGGLNPASILLRLKNIFETPPGSRRVVLTTDEVLANFGDLPDQFAPIFREMLR